MNVFDLDYCRRCGSGPIGHQEDYCDDCIVDVQKQWDSLNGNKSPIERGAGDENERGR